MPRPNEIFRRIGVVNDSERLAHNYKLVKERKSKYQLGDFYSQKKEFDRLRNFESSLPKLGYLYAKKEELVYNNLKKLHFQKNY
jgi:predicted RNA-binding protein with EMAP domain